MENFKDIWFVDDDTTFRYLIKDMMDESTYADDINYFDDGDRAVMQLLKMKRTGHKGPKVIFLDLSMKYVDGWELLDLLNEFDMKTRVVILTSSVSERDRVRASRDALVNAYLTKPVERQTIVDVIEQLPS